MINKLKRILREISGGIAKGMIYGNMVLSNGGGVVIEQALE